jgi:hypothetical protein
VDQSDTSVALATASQSPPSRKKPKRPEPQRHQWFDAWKVANGGGLKTLVDSTVRLIGHHEDHTQARTRARKAVDEAHHLKRIEVVLCNLAHAVLVPPPTGRIAVKLGNGRKGRSRYDSPVFSKRLSPLIMMLVDLDFLDVRAPSVMRGEVSSIAPSAWFARKVAEFGVQLSDFGRDGNEEVILLNRNIRSLGTWAQTGSRSIHREPIDYTDTVLTRKYREEVRYINEFLSRADIDFLDDGLKPRIDPFGRTLKRRFVLLTDQATRLDQGGRLYGGFWQNLKTERRRNIRINGEPVAVLDYGSMFTRLAYAEVGATPPSGDLYAIPGLEGYRSGVKLAMNAFLFDGGPRRSWPSELGIGVGDDTEAAASPTSSAAAFEARLPEGWSVSTAKEAILRRHPALKNAWGRQLGYQLMFKESQILVAVLQDLFSRDITALGLHDGLLIPQSKVAVAKQVMTMRGKEMTGIILPVSHKQV